MPKVTLPTPCASSASFGLLRADNATELLSGAEVYTVFAKAVWTLSFQLVLMKENESDGLVRKWRSALTRLSSFGNYFESSPPGYTVPVYTGLTPVVDGAGQIGKDLDIKGATPGATVLLDGEYFQIGTELKMVTEDCVADGSGQANLKFDPPLRVSPGDEDSLVLNNPVAKFRLVEPKNNWGIQPGKINIMQIDAIESFAS